MARTASSTIVLRSNNPDNGMQRPMEKLCQAGVTIRPGMLLMTGTLGTVKPHATAGGARQNSKVALENPWLSGSGDAIDTPYAAGERVAYLHALPGDVLYMLLETGANVAEGDPLESNGAGALQPAAGDTDVVVGYAEEAVNNSSGSDVRIRVRMT